MSKFEISSSQVFVNLNTRYSVDKFNDPVFKLNWRQLPVCVNTSLRRIWRKQIMNIENPEKVHHTRNHLCLAFCIFVYIP